MLLSAARCRRSAARFLTFLAPAAVAASVALAPTVGHASERIPGELQDELALGCTPTCLLCHTVITGGDEFLNPFGESMESQGLLVGDGVQRVFDSDGPASMNDLDMDGVDDRQEIINNTDPGSPDDNPICADVTYGCGARVAPEAPTPWSGWAAGLALGVALLLWRQRRRV